jgi:hypothetical protein
MTGAFPAASEPSLPDKVLAIHQVLVEGKAPHAVGGALALAYYAEPRATVDIDLNLFVPVTDWARVVDALISIGVSADDLDKDALQRDGQCRLWWGDNPVDLFFANAPIHKEMPSEVRKVPFAGSTIPILGPEHLAVCKVMFDRPKDWLDIEQMLLAADQLDVSKIERLLIEMVGEEDHRVKRFQAIQPPG